MNNLREAQRTQYSPTTTTEMRNSGGQLATAARILTTPVIYEPDVLRKRLITDRDRQRDIYKARAQGIIDVLVPQLHSLRTSLQSKDIATDRALDAFDAGDESKLKEFGLDCNGAWITDIVAAIIDGRPVEIETMQPVAMTSLQDGENLIDSYPLLPYAETSMQVTKLLRTINGVARNLRVTAWIDDYKDPVSDEFFADIHRNSFTVSTALHLLKNGVITEEDKPGKDFLIRRAGDQVERTSDVMKRLDASGRGSVVRDINTGVKFYPNSNFTSMLDLPASDKIDLELQGISLQYRDTSSTSSLLKVSGYLDSVSDQVVHVALHNDHPVRRKEQQQIYTLLRALDILGRERYHDIFFNSRNLKPELVVYGVGKLLELHARKILSNLENDTSFGEMSENFGYTYIRENYGKDMEGKGYEWDILPADVTIIEKLLERIDTIIPEGGFTHSVNIGRGSFSYLDQLFAPFVHYVMEMREPSGPMRDVVELWKRSQLSSEYDVGSKFEKLMVAKGGDLYQGSEALAKKRAWITDEGIDTLPTQRYPLIMESFTSCSIAREKSDFYELIKTKAKALIPSKDSRMVAVHMVGSKGWDGFAAVCLSLDDIRNAYRDADLEIIEVIPVMSKDRTREGYDGMAVVIARPLKVTPPKKLKR